MSFRKKATKGSRTVDNHFRVTSDLNKRIEVFWKEKTYTDFEGKECRFESFSAFIEYVMAVFVFCGEDGWKMFSKQKLKPFLI